MGGEFAGEVRGCNDMVRDDIAQFFEPEKGKLGQHAPIVGNGSWKHDVKGR